MKDENKLQSPETESGLRLVKIVHVFISDLFTFCLSEERQAGSGSGPCWPGAESEPENINVLASSHADGAELHRSHGYPLLAVSMATGASSQWRTKRWSEMLFRLCRVKRSPSFSADLTLRSRSSGSDSTSGSGTSTIQSQMSVNPKCLFIKSEDSKACLIQSGNVYYLH